MTVWLGFAIQCCYKNEKHTIMLVVFVATYMRKICESVREKVETCSVLPTDSSSHFSRKTASILSSESRVSPAVYWSSLYNVSLNKNSEWLWIFANFYWKYHWIYMWKAWDPVRPPCQLYVTLPLRQQKKSQNVIMNLSVPGYRWQLKHKSTQ